MTAQMIHHYFFVNLKIPCGRKCCNGSPQELAGSRSKLQPQTSQHSTEVGAKGSENGQTSLPSQRKRGNEKGEIITQKITSEMGVGWGVWYTGTTLWEVLETYFAKSPRMQALIPFR